MNSSVGLAGRLRERAREIHRDESDIEGGIPVVNPDAHERIQATEL